MIILKGPLKYLPPNARITKEKKHSKWFVGLKRFNNSSHGVDAYDRRSKKAFEIRGILGLLLRRSTDPVSTEIETQPVANGYENDEEKVYYQSLMVLRHSVTCRKN